MRKLIFIFILLSWRLYVIQAQTLHGIIFANTECPGDPRNPRDRGIGPSVENDYYRMKIEMTTIASFIGYKLDLQSFTGSQDIFCRENLDNVLNNLKCNKDDIVFFYYSGHGSRSINEKTDFPQMNFVVDPYKTHIDERTANYPLYNVLQRIKEKNSRLTLVIGDMCNSVANWVTPKDAPPACKEATVKSESPCKFYKDLFLGVKGSLIATSSKPKETSEAYADGGAFTKGLLNVLQIMVSENMTPDWTLLMEGSIVATQKITNNKQTPIYESDLHKIEVVDAVQSEQPVTPAPEESITFSEEIDVSKYLTTIGNENTSESTRITLMDKTLNHLFASPRVKVEVVGRDGKTIVSTKDADSYLNWLSITTGLEQVMVVDYKVDTTNKITYLKVHEMYNYKK